MNILALGEERRLDELKKAIPDKNEITYQQQLGGASLQGFDLVIDLNFDDDPKNAAQYVATKEITVLAGAVKLQLSAAFANSPHESITLIGMNTLPTFIDRNLKELSLFDKKEEGALEKIAQELGWQYQIVEDRVGMVTPRIIFMIINEACYTLQEGTASIEDIDLAMKLGTNYPYGPFEWADKIGLKDIYETLEAIYLDTHDERYKICPLLKTKYLRKESFY